MTDWLGDILLQLIFFAVMWGAATLATILSIFACIRWKGLWKVAAILPILIAWCSIPWGWIIKAMHPEQDPLMAILLPATGIAGCIALAILALIHWATRPKIQSA